jgi:hypothetical protein
MAYIGQTPSAVPLDGSDIADDIVDSQHYAAGSIDTAHLADDQITLAKMAAGTDGNIISYDASGNPVAIATGSSGQVLTSGGAGAAPSFAAAGGGKLLQVLIVSDTTPMDLSSATYTDTNLSLSITPSATSSKILVMWNVQAEAMAASTGFGTRLVRGSTNVYTSATAYDTYTSIINVRVRSDYKHLDSPSTTSAVVYKVQVSTYSNRQCTFNDGSNQTQLVLMEIGA